MNSIIGWQCSQILSIESSLLEIYKIQVLLIGYLVYDVNLFNANTILLPLDRVHVNL